VPVEGGRWATFDCYGTLVDWDVGVGSELERLFGAALRDSLLARYHELEPAIENASPGARYRDVMRAVLAELAASTGLELPVGEADALARSLPRWPVFPEVRAELTEANRRGWQLVILSNTDADLLDASIEAIGVPFSGAIVASDIGSYKPAHRHWQAFYERTQADTRRHVHIAQSHFHDVVPSCELGIRSIWVNRRGEHARPSPTAELPDLRGLADMLDAFVP